MEIDMTERYEAIVIGTGFGGAITACRTSKKWPGKVLVLERGKRYPMGSFPRTPHEVARNFWNVPDEGRSRPARLPSDQEQHGMFDIRAFRRMTVVLGAGLGGGSLIYANVFLEPPDHVFDERWPESCRKERLMPYYRIAREVLGSRPIPRTGDDRRRVVRTELFERVADEIGRDSKLVDLNVFFGNDFQNPLPIGEQDRNRYGALQTSCVYCAECAIGCNTHSKNTLDLNYLFVAENRHGAEVLTEQLVEKVVPLDERGEDDPGADGTHGYRVQFLDLTAGHAPRSAVARRVIVCAGTLGSGELLLRAKHVDKTLPRLSDQLGQGYSGNGDFLSFVLDSEPPADPNHGPIITQRIDYNLFKDFHREHAFLLEDSGYPAQLSWYLEGTKPGLLRLAGVWQALVSTARRWITRSGGGELGRALGELLKGDASYNTAVLLCMGVDESNGVLCLDSSDNVEITWPYKESLPLYKAMVEAGKQFQRAAGAKRYLPVPTWRWPFRQSSSVHSLGGCRLADDPSRGVTSADRATFGQAFGYRGLYVADGSIVPTAVGANPTATISALSEMVAEGITGITPDADL